MQSVLSLFVGIRVSCQMQEFLLGWPFKVEFGLVIGYVSYTLQIPLTVSCVVCIIKLLITFLCITTFPCNVGIMFWVNCLFTFLFVGLYETYYNLGQFYLPILFFHVCGLLFPLQSFGLSSGNEIRGSLIRKCLM